MKKGCCDCSSCSCFSEDTSVKYAVFEDGHEEKIFYYKRLPVRYGNVFEFMTESGHYMYDDRCVEKCISTYPNKPSITLQQVKIYKFEHCLERDISGEFIVAVNRCVCDIDRIEFRCVRKYQNKEEE